MGEQTLPPSREETAIPGSKSRRRDILKLIPCKTISEMSSGKNLRHTDSPLRASCQRIFFTQENFSGKCILSRPQLAACCDSDQWLHYVDLFLFCSVHQTVQLPFWNRHAWVLLGTNLVAFLGEIHKEPYPSPQSENPTLSLAPS